ncbi:MULTISPECIES: hypothetical protein [unclassified Bradyrhizobium]|uniref:hypothetical protein n=1 Tax=unclassified Bradyrhizobium TaxID=2631580 RepID=UPI002012431A|nr:MULTISPECIES: hypothetical protein [unclassified Bradyrhizobium]
MQLLQEHRHVDLQRTESDAEQQREPKPDAGAGAPGERSLGSSRGDARRSSRSIATNETIAVTIRPSFSKDDPTAEVADVAAMARQISATRPSGTRADDEGRAAVTGGSTKKAAIASTAAVAALATKAPRQLAKCANIPRRRFPVISDSILFLK